jgi:hypothetical protein
MRPPTASEVLMIDAVDAAPGAAAKPAAGVAGQSAGAGSTHRQDMAKGGGKR